LEKEFNEEYLKSKAYEMRVEILNMISNAGSGHPGGALSAVEVVAYLYFYKMNIDPKNPRWEDRDRFVLSKGHTCPVIYAALAARGYFEKEVLSTLRAIGSPLQGHPDMNKTIGVDMTTGSLGQGVSAAGGMALGAKLQKKDFTVYAMVGDGEVQSGQLWEMAMSSSYFKLDNFVVIVDYNKIQCDDLVSNVMEIYPVVEKFEAFGWEAYDIDGHSFTDIHKAFSACSQKNGKPKVIVSNTIKGKGLLTMEGNHKWHGTPPSKQELEEMLKEIGGAC